MARGVGEEGIKGWVSVTNFRIQGEKVNNSWFEGLGRGRVSKKPQVPSVNWFCFDGEKTSVCDLWEGELRDVSRGGRGPPVWRAEQLVAETSRGGTF